MELNDNTRHVPAPPPKDISIAAQYISEVICTLSLPELIAHVTVDLEYLGLSSFLCVKRGVVVGNYLEFGWSSQDYEKDGWVSVIIDHPDILTLKRIHELESASDHALSEKMHQRDIVQLRRISLGPSQTNIKPPAKRRFSNFEGPPESSGRKKQKTINDLAPIMTSDLSTSSRTPSRHGSDHLSFSPYSGRRASLTPTSSPGLVSPLRHLSMSTPTTSPKSVIPSAPNDDKFTVPLVRPASGVTTGRVERYASRSTQVFDNFLASFPLNFDKLDKTNLEGKRVRGESQENPQKMVLEGTGKGYSAKWQNQLKLVEVRQVGRRHSVKHL